MCRGSEGKVRNKENMEDRMGMQGKLEGTRGRVYFGKKWVLEQNRELRT